MAPRAFYTVDPNAYLFGRQQTPEEQVRQWALFELLSTHGILINDLQIERPVKIGTRIHYADIVVLKECTPHVVIECKRQEENDLTIALDQAISYADANTMRAEYAVCTNGSVWLVKRKINNDWVPAPGLHRRRISDSELMKMDEFLDVNKKLRFLFQWLHRPVPISSVKDFFAILQELVEHDFSTLFEGVNLSLHGGTSLLLRALRIDPSISGHYGISRVKIALSHYMQYSKSIGVELSDLIPREYLKRELVVELEILLRDLVQSSKGINHPDVYFIRFAYALSRYLSECERIGSPIEISEGIVNEFQLFIEPFCEDKLGIQLPDRLSHSDFLLAARAGAVD